MLGLELIVLAGILIGGSEGLAVPVPAVSAAAYTGSKVMVTAGACCGIAGVMSWLVLSGWTRRQPRRGHGPGSRVLRPEA